KPVHPESTFNISKLLEIPIFTGPEYVALDFYIEKMLEKVPGITPEKLKILKSSEEKYIRHVIIKYLPQLKELYQEYATIASKTKLNFEPVMIRLFLWQFYKDKEIHKCGIS